MLSIYLTGKGTPTKSLHPDINVYMERAVNAFMQKLWQLVENEIALDSEKATSALPFCSGLQTRTLA